MNSVSFFEPMIWTADTAASLLYSAIMITVASAVEMVFVLFNKNGSAVVKFLLLGNVILYFFVPLLLTGFYWQAYGGFFIEYCTSLHFTAIGFWVFLGGGVFPLLLIWRQKVLSRIEMTGVFLWHFLVLSLAICFVYDHTTKFEKWYAGSSHERPCSDVRIFYVLADGYSLVELDGEGRELLVYRFRSRPYGLSIRKLGDSVLIFSNHDESDGYLVESVHYSFDSSTECYPLITAHASSLECNLREPGMSFRYQDYPDSPLIQTKESEVFGVSNRYVVLRINTGIFLYDSLHGNLSRIGTGLRLQCFLKRSPEETRRNGMP